MISHRKFYASLQQMTSVFKYLFTARAPRRVPTIQIIDSPADAGEFPDPDLAFATWSLIKYCGDSQLLVPKRHPPLRPLSRLSLSVNRHCRPHRRLATASLIGHLQEATNS